MREEATSEKTEVAWKASKAKVQLMNDRASAFSETPGGMQGCPLGRRILYVSTTGCLAVKHDDPTLPIAWVRGVRASKVLHLFH